MAQIRLKALRKTYNQSEVLHGIDMDIANGEFVVIVGPSGCGKSTLLRMVAGLETVTAGEIHIGERMVNSLEPAQRDIAMVFQNYALYPHMSVRQNMSYGLRIRGLPREQIEARVSTVAATLGLEALLDRRPRELSGGQRQRVAMGRAIVREPAVFLFDEPLSNLDAKLRVQMRVELELLHQRLQTTSLYVTHDQVEAMTLADRIVILNAGQVEQIGTPAEVYARPASTFVAGFIGQPPMNLLPVSQSAEGLFLAGGNAGRDPLHLALPLADLPEEFIVGCRPEHLQVALSGQADFSARVRVVENLGADTHAYCSIGEQEIIVRLAAGSNLRSGDLLPLHISSADVHCFAADTGKRIATGNPESGETSDFREGLAQAVA
jgi:sn-glycerol 3-phosphate transport system ATP-binding protein